MVCALTIETVVFVAAQPVNAKLTFADRVKVEADRSDFRTRGFGGAADRVRQRWKVSDLTTNSSSGVKMASCRGCACSHIIQAQFFMQDARTKVLVKLDWSAREKSPCA